MEQYKIEFINSYYDIYKKIKPLTAFICIIILFAVMGYFNGSEKNDWLIQYSSLIIPILYFVYLIYLIGKKKNNILEYIAKQMLLAILVVSVQFIILGEITIQSQFGIRYIFLSFSIILCVVSFIFFYNFIKNKLRKDKYKRKFNAVYAGIPFAGAISGLLVSRNISFNPATEALLLSFLTLCGALMFLLASTSLCEVLSLLKNDPTLEEKCREARENPPKEEPEQTKKR